MTDLSLIRDLLVRVAQGSGDSHPIIDNPVLWRTNGVCDMTVVEPVPVAIITDWCDIPYGPVWDATKGGGFDVIGTAPTRYRANGTRNANARDIIRFHASGYEQEVDRTASKNGQITDPFKPSVAGIGYMGGFEGKVRDPDVEPIYKSWNSMIQRCYDTTHSSYKAYGAKGIRVCRRWWSFDAFYRDSSAIPGYPLKKTDALVAIDKDHFGNSGVYSPDTCLWVSREVNNGYIGNKAFEAISPDGEVFYHFSASHFARIHSLTQTKVSEALKGIRKGEYRGWNFHHVAENYGYSMYRSPIRDTIQALLRGENHQFCIGNDLLVGFDLSDEGISLYVEHANELDEATSIQIYWLLGKIIARSVGAPFLSLTHVMAGQETIMTTSTIVVDKQVQHINDVRPELIGYQGDAIQTKEWQLKEYVRVNHGDKGTVEYMTWCNMHQRCSNPNRYDYCDWGGRGIFVVPEWHGGNGYLRFLEDMGRRPGPEYSIDRIDNDGPYSAINCRWATRKEQANNRRPYRPRK